MDCNHKVLFEMIAKQFSLIQGLLKELVEKVEKLEAERDAAPGDMDMTGDK